MAPEEPVIDPSSLTKFRKLRLKNVDLLDLLNNKTVEIAIEKEIIKSKSIIVDATHTKARYNQKSPKEILMESVAANQVDTYYFDIEKCKHCPFKEGCYKEGAKSKTYSVSIKSNVQTEQMEFQESDYFKEKSKERYKIEAKSSELKHRHGVDVAKSSGLIGMELQGAMAIFTVNIKRILKLLG